MIEQEQDYLDVAKEFLNKAQGRDTSLPEALAQIALAAALITKIEDDRMWRWHISREERNLKTGG